MRFISGPIAAGSGAGCWYRRASRSCSLLAPVAAQATTRTFHSTGNEQTFTVPAGVSVLHVVAVGGKGGTGSASGGFGARASADLAVTAGEVLYIEVGGNGASENSSSASLGGFNGGGDGTLFSGGGGGASDVRLSPMNVGLSPDRRVVVAGGGGGGGYWYEYSNTSTGETGGAAGANGTDGDHGNGIGSQGRGGGAGTSTAGGAGGTGCSGSCDGTVGAQGTGGTGAETGEGDGGGGGGGLFGGGGGGGGSTSGAPPFGGGGGGGGGSSGFGAGTSHRSVVTDTRGVPSITLTYTVTYTLAVTKAGSGSGTVISSPAGIDCGKACGHKFASGSSVTLTAKPAAGSKFAGWSGACTGTGACRLTVNASKRVTATFNVIPPPNTTVTGAFVTTGGGKATLDFKGAGGFGKLHFQCQLDSKGWQACSSPKTYTGLAHGRHTFKVRAIDARGKADPTPAVHTFVI